MRFHRAKIVGTNVDPETYHATNIARGKPGRPMSRSSLCLFAECPNKWLNGFERKDTDSTEWGELIDTLALQLSRLNDRYVVTPDTYPDKAGNPKQWNWNANFCDEWRKEQAPRICLKPSEMKAAGQAVEGLRLDQEVRYVLDTSDKQVMVMAEYRDRETGLVIPVQTLIDIVPLAQSMHAQSLADLKTSFTASGRRWNRICYERGYHVQAALSLDLYNAASGEKRDSFFHIVQENFEPYHIATPLPMLSQEFIELGRKFYQQALRDYCQCLKSGEWPSYAPANTVIDPFQMIEPEAWMDGVRAMFQSINPVAPLQDAIENLTYLQ
jgi:hypothetical protein